MQSEPSEAIKPCPFCGNDGSGPVEDALHVSYIEDDQHVAYDRYTVQCDKCTATMGYSVSEDEAIAAWNTRALDPDATRTDSPTDAVVQKMVRVINGNLTTGISMGQAERYADEDTALAVLAALRNSSDGETK